MRYALRYMKSYGMRFKYLDCYGRALNTCSIEHNLCVNCGEMKKCVRMWSHLCEEKRFKKELKSIDFRQTHALSTINGMHELYLVEHKSWRNPIEPFGV